MVNQIVNPVIHGTRKKVKDVHLCSCKCGTEQLPWIWNTGYWNIS